jgi:carboxymethylenebutenolidase
MKMRPLWILVLAAMTGSAAAAPAETVAFASGNKVLHGLIFKPEGDGPFPVILYNHGSAEGMANSAAFDALAPMFVSQGWAFFAPYRRGQGLSADAGPYIGEQIAAARERGGATLAGETMVRLLQTEQLDDQLAALAWLNRQPFVHPSQIAVMGNSFGAIESVLGAEHDGYCAAVDAAGGAESWQAAPALRAMLLESVRRARVPILFFQAENDYSVEPSRVLYAAMKAANKPAELHVYPAFGNTPEAGHSFAWRGVRAWQDDVLDFLNRSCRGGLQ